MISRMNLVRTADSGGKRKVVSQTPLAAKTAAAKKPAVKATPAKLKTGLAKTAAAVKTSAANAVNSVKTKTTAAANAAKTAPKKTASSGFTSGLADAAKTEAKKTVTGKTPAKTGFVSGMVDAAKTEAKKKLTPQSSAPTGFVSGMVNTAKTQAQKVLTDPKSEKTGFISGLIGSALKASAGKTVSAVKDKTTAAVNAAKTSNAAGTQTGKKNPAAQTGGSQGSGTGTASGASVQTPAVDSGPITFESLFREMMERYRPETVAYTPVDENVLRDTIIEWLRPAYDQAIARRREQTDRSNAELDADAWARGMGASTYVTDVKGRAFRNEARDVDDLESDYASTLAGHLFDALKSQQEQKVEVDRFNAEQQNLANERATEAALKLYQTYLNAMQQEEEPKAASYSGGGTSKSNAKDAVKKVQSSVSKIASAFMNAAKQNTGTKTASGVDLKTATNLIARMTPQQRNALYSGKGTYAQQYREILNGIGSSAFTALMRQYPAS